MIHHQVEARDRVGGRSFRAQLKPPVVHEPLWVDEGEARDRRMGSMQEQ